MKERKFVATVVVIRSQEVMQRYYHDELDILKGWVAREGYNDTPDFTVMFHLNPMWVDVLHTM